MKTVLQLEGLHCGNCVKSVENALSNLPAVNSVRVDLATQRAEIDGEADLNLLIDTIEGLGFDVVLK